MERPHYAPACLVLVLVFLNFGNAPRDASGGGKLVVVEEGVWPASMERSWIVPSVARMERLHYAPAAFVPLPVLSLDMLPRDAGGAGKLSERKQTEPVCGSRGLAAGPPLYVCGGFQQSPGCTLRQGIVFLVLGSGLAALVHCA